MKRQRHVKALSALLLLLYCSHAGHAQGALQAIYFPGNGVLTPSPGATTNSFVHLGTALKDSLALSSFTIELWVKMGATNSVNPVLIGDKDWASGSNTGFILSYYASTDASSGTAPANDIRFNFKTVGGARVDYDIAFPAAISQRWNHIAITVNRSGSIIGYLNGVATGHAYVAGAENIAADAARSLAGTLPVRLGTDGKTNGYRAPFNGTMDEVRIWKAVRTPQELRDNMCHKLAGTESDLLAYYNMDETSGTNIINNAVATVGSFNGTWVNNMSGVNSSAPVGDASVAMYSADLSDSVVSINSSAHGNFSIINMGNTMQGIQLYETDRTPANITGITNPDNKYYAVFPVNNDATYDVAYDYSNYPGAVSNSATIAMYQRANPDSVWVSAGFTKDIASGTFSNTGLAGAKEMMLGDFNISPLALDLLSFNVEKSADQSKALLAWTIADGAKEPSFEIERSNNGVVFLEIGSTDKVSNKGGKGNSTYNFTDEMPLSGANYYRIKAMENDGTFKYFPVKSIRFNKAEDKFSLFPNPFNNQLTLNYASQVNTILHVAVYDLVGKEISRQHIQVSPSVSQYPVDVTALPDGVFFINIQDPNSNYKATIKIIKK